MQYMVWRYDMDSIDTYEDGEEDATLVIFGVKQLYKIFLKIIDTSVF